MARGLRRSEPAAPSFNWRSGLPLGTKNPAVTAPDQGTVDLVSGEATSSMAPAFGPATAVANYKDEASQPKPNKPSGHQGGVPFDLTR